MKCDKCKKDFNEELIEESHDIPCYLFEGNRKGRKNQADKHGRHLLCRKCHKEYETTLNIILRLKSKDFAIFYFQEEKEDDTKTTTEP